MSRDQLEVLCSGDRVLGIFNGRALKSVNGDNCTQAIKRLCRAVLSGDELWIDEINGELIVKLYRRIHGSYDAPIRLDRLAAESVYGYLSPPSRALTLPALIAVQINT